MLSQKSYGASLDSPDGASWATWAWREKKWQEGANVYLSPWISIGMDSSPFSSDVPQIIDVPQSTL